MSAKKKTQTVVFLDRDGTINVDYGYVTSPDRVQLIPGSAQAVGDLKRAGVGVIIVSNQSAVGRGMAAVEDIELTNRELERLLIAADRDAVIDQILYCPEAPETAGPRRKPGIGMLKEVRAPFDTELSWVIGDKPSDIHFGMNAGIPRAQCLLVLTGEGRKSKLKLSEEKLEVPVFQDLPEAVRHILTSALDLQ